MSLFTQICRHTHYHGNTDIRMLPWKPTNLWHQPWNIETYIGVHLTWPPVHPECPGSRTGWKWCSHTCWGTFGRYPVWTWKEKVLYKAFCVGISSHHYFLVYFTFLELKDHSSPMESIIIMIQYTTVLSYKDKESCLLDNACVRAFNRY